MRSPSIAAQHQRLQRAADAAVAADPEKYARIDAERAANADRADVYRAECKATGADFDLSRWQDIREGIL